LIYNMCWEDPRIDRQLLDLNQDSQVVVLTSAGCNALDYLLDAPAAIHAVDVNPRQNALLQLKLALIGYGDFGDLEQMFRRGSHPRFRELYESVRSRLPAYAAAFWDRKIAYFDTTNRKKSFYYHGTCGAVAWLVSRQLLKSGRKLRDYLFDLLDARTLEEQRELYRKIEPALWGRFSTWLLRQPTALALLGVPRPQIRLIQQQYPGGVIGYISDKLRHVLTEVLIQDNYFWRAYLTGSYTERCCPNYLREENFAHLRAHLDRIHTYDTTVSGFLNDHPGEYSHFVLLDHQDWLAWHQPQALEEEWRLILANSRPGSRILLRSAGDDIDFLPDWTRQALRFFPALTEPLHSQDRVGTYGSLHFAEVL
ncbi:MAG: BtaA family protein, partial [Candidatus Competibacteraceae bacterium]|nr:BtaA family protein [Candidatus Competibacteraceae bacterium]